MYGGNDLKSDAKFEGSGSHYLVVAVSGEVTPEGIFHSRKRRLDYEFI